MEQLHLAPSIYLATVVEVVRRRSFRYCYRDVKRDLLTSCALVFSQQYLKKAGLIAGTFSDVHTEEMRTRHLFQEKLNRHFLASMFQVSQQPRHLN